LAGAALALALWLLQGPVAAWFAGRATLRDEATLAVLAVVGAIVYGGVVLALFGSDWLARLRRRAARPTPP
jgi:hypothetical protein